MRIVKPYGSSQTHAHGNGSFERLLHPSSFPDEPVAIRVFAETHPKLVIAQWISCIDKVITKPNGNTPPSEDQWFLRNALGDAAWKLIVARDLLHAPEKRLKRLEREWWSRIHPYGSDADRSAPQSFRGRWYAALVGSAGKNTFDADRVAQTIYDHLYRAAYRIEPGQPQQRLGLLAARADSIAGNVNRSSLPSAPLEFPWSDEDKLAYARPGDLAHAITKHLRDLEGQREATLRRGTAALLATHLAAILSPRPDVQPDGTAPSGLLALHKEVRKTYKGILEGNQQQLAKKLPQDIEALLSLVERKFLNRRINALVRLGRVIHYSATPDGGNSHTANVITNWPADVRASRYWTSNGQAEIKRNEAFVKSWRGMLAMASRTLTDWADPGQTIGRDILGASEISRAISNLDAAAFDRKARLLFGARSGTFTQLPLDAKQETLSLALRSVQHLRNSAFHFVGLAGFLNALTGLGARLTASVRPSILGLWNSDRGQHDARILQTLTALRAHHLMSLPECESVLATIQHAGLQLTELPALRRVLARASLSWTFDKYRLQLAGTEAGADHPARECQYFCMSLIYERDFARWFRTMPHHLLSEFVDRSVTRATIEARKATQDDTVNARTTGRFKITEADTTTTFFSRLNAALTAESRDIGQNTSPNEVGKFLSDLQCDVVAQAFERYLEERGLLWLAAELGDRVPTDTARFALDSLNVEQKRATPEDWQAVLYFVFHLVPVDDVAKLSHRIGRFRTDADGQPASLPGLSDAIDLYRVMHDAKFSGYLQTLDRTEHSLLLAQLTTDDLGGLDLLPRLRGVREFFRFGDNRTLSTVFANFRVSGQEAARLQSSSAAVAQDQLRRSNLHKRWVDRRGKLSREEIEEYRVLLTSIAEHRHLSDHVTLLNHLRLHRLLINILAKLLDFSAQWERDLYFVTLAVMNLRQLTPVELFQRYRGAYPLDTGQIIPGLRNLADSAEAGVLRAILSKVFGVSDPGIAGASVRTRNDLAHFNCLQTETTPIDLTELTNRTRSLMAYDRKQQNAVSKAIISLLAREGLQLQWTFKDGLLSEPRLAARTITHLKDGSLVEKLVGDRFARMAAALF